MSANLRACPSSTQYIAIMLTRAFVSGTVNVVLPYIYSFDSWENYQTWLSKAHSSGAIRFAVWYGSVRACDYPRIADSVTGFQQIEERGDF